MIFSKKKDSKKQTFNLVKIAALLIHAAKIEENADIPTYYYLYRVGGINLKSEQQRRCPQCDGDWALKESIHQVFDFKCDDCRLVSNLSWDYN